MDDCSPGFNLWMTRYGSRREVLESIAICCSDAAMMLRKFHKYGGRSYQLVMVFSDDNGPVCCSEGYEGIERLLREYIRSSTCQSPCVNKGN